MTPLYFTICARNYLAFAACLAASLRTHERSRLVVWLLDPGEVPALPAGIETRPIEDAIPRDELARLRFRYDLLELATAVKPRCFARHFDEGEAHVVYLDPDIELFRPLGELRALLAGGSNGVLTPHVLAPLPRDGAQPDDLTLLRAGVHNLGFLALAAGTSSTALLDWWWGWLRTHCFVDPGTGTFTDQKWMNFAPLFWSGFEVLRDPTYNVAYWNLAQRQLAHESERWLVDGRPLAFFHYSGFDPHRPELLSKHQTRLDVPQGSAVSRLLEGYAERLLAAGHEPLRRIAVPSPVFENGVPADDIARRALRQAESEGLRFGDPLAAGRGSFLAWLSSPVFRDVEERNAQPITRYLLALYEARPDVRRFYPDLYGADRRGFLQWARDKAVEEMNASSELLALQLRTARPDAPLRRAQSSEPVPPAVELAGYLRAALGIGEAARGYLRALEAVGIPASTVDVSELTSSPLTERVSQRWPAMDAGIRLIHVNPDQLLHFRDLVGADFFRESYNVGLWAWETQEFPIAWYDRFALLDEVWVPSSFIADAVSRASPIPVLRMPHVVEALPAAADRARFGLGRDEVVFLFSFDFHSTLSRKNPEGVLDAFVRAFRPDERVRLVLKSLNARSRPGELERLVRRAVGHRVTFLDEALTGEERWRLLHSADAYVSLHRAEGFGLGIAEAMAAGKPVVATGWSGNMDYMTAENSFPVRYRLEPLEREDPPYAAGSLWAVPDLEHAAACMRRVFDDRSEAAAIGRKAKADVDAALGVEVVGRRLRERLEWIAARQEAVSASTVRSGTAAALSMPARDTRPALVRALRRAWLVTLAMAPERHHPRLHRLTAGLRRKLGARMA